MSKCYYEGCIAHCYNYVNHCGTFKDVKNCDDYNAVEKQRTMNSMKNKCKHKQEIDHE